MKLIKLFAVAALGCAAFAADLNGKWTATVQGRGGQSREVTYIFKVEGSKLTGTTTGMGGNTIDLQDGKVDGDNIEFKTKVEFNGNSMVMLYKGKVEAGEIKFTQTREGGEMPPREFVAKRAAS